MLFLFNLIFLLNTHCNKYLSPPHVRRYTLKKSFAYCAIVLYALFILGISVVGYSEVAKTQ